MKPDIMTDLLIYLQYIGKIIVSAKTLLTTSKGVAVTVPVITFAITNDIKTALLFLAITFNIDFVTGIYASFIENRDAKKLEGILKTGFLNKLLLFFDTITSEKLRNSIVKAIGYALFILLVYGIEKVFVIKSFVFLNISNKNWTITLIAQAFCIAIEVYSIIFENIKRAGYDIAGQFVKVIKEFKTIKNEIKE